jgi:hypothetical protein
MTAGVCWQFTVKQKQKARDPDIHFRAEPSDAIISRIEFAEAREFIVQYEWLGNVGSAKYCYGLWLGCRLAAVVCYSTPSAANAFRSLLGPKTAKGMFQLCRGASSWWAPSWAPSKLIASSLRHMASTRGAVGVVAYADPEAGEVGTVYQASNAYYLGLTQSRGPGKYIIGGITYHARAVQKRFGCAAHQYLVEIDPAYRRIQRTKKHRYLFLLARGRARREMLEKVQAMVKPYPKRHAELLRQ